MRLAILFLGTTLFAADSAPFVLRTDVDLVLVPVTLMDRRGAMVNDLERGHFTVLQDNAPQPIVSFSKENAPCTLAIVLDTSESMSQHLDVAKLLTGRVLAGTEDRDEAFLVSVSDKPVVDSPLTTDAASVQSLLPFISPGGNTALVDTIFLALQELRTAHNARRALLIVSDGMDNNSSRSKAELMRMAVEADVQIYTVSIGSRARVEKSLAGWREREGLAFLSDLADKTGGLNYSVDSETSAAHVAAEVGRALRDQYVIGYAAPHTDTSGKWHRIRVKLDLPKISVYARGGYYSR